MNPVPIKMFRENWDGLPQHALPEGYSLRMYQPGDDVTWTAIQAASDDINDVTLSWFRKDFGEDDDVIGKRMFFLCDGDGKAIGTASAWMEEWRGQSWGLVHWVAILPAYQGQGLAKPLLSAVCQRLIDLGHERCFLCSESTRIPAINLYLKFGFKPWVETEADKAVWDGIEEVIKKRNIN